MAIGLLDKLIAFDANGASEERREAMREISDRFMVAIDRYDNRRMAGFDLLLTRSASSLERNIKRLMAAFLIKSGEDEDEVNACFEKMLSPNAPFLRRSVIRTQDDILNFLYDNTPGSPLCKSLPTEDGDSLRLPSALREWSFDYLLTAYVAYFEEHLKPAHLDRVRELILRRREEILLASGKAAVDEITLARRAVRENMRTGKVNSDTLLEQIEARAMTEFLFSCIELFDIDSATVFRVMNDRTFESFSIFAKGAGVPRSTLAKIVCGFSRRASDDPDISAILRLYDRLPAATAERAIRFWRMRVRSVSDAVNAGDLHSARRMLEA